jgi:hypothetical protein
MQSMLQRRNLSLTRCPSPLLEAFKRANHRRNRCQSRTVRTLPTFLFLVHALEIFSEPMLLYPRRSIAGDHPQSSFARCAS